MMGLSPGRTSEHFGCIIPGVAAQDIVVGSTSQFLLSPPWAGCTIWCHLLPFPGLNRSCVSEPISIPSITLAVVPAVGCFQHCLSLCWSWLCWLLGFHRIRESPMVCLGRGLTEQLIPSPLL